MSSPADASRNGSVATQPSIKKPSVYHFVKCDESGATEQHMQYLRIKAEMDLYAASMPEHGAEATENTAQEDQV